MIKFEFVTELEIKLLKCDSTWHIVIFHKESKIFNKWHINLVLAVLNSPQLVWHLKMTTSFWTFTNRTWMNSFKNLILWTLKFPVWATFIIFNKNKGLGRFTHFSRVCHRICALLTHICRSCHSINKEILPLIDSAICFNKFENISH